MVGETQALIGDVDEWSNSTSATTDDEKPFYIEKYVRIWDVDGSSDIYSPTDAKTLIQSNSDLQLNLSDVYPGDLAIVTDENGNEVGLEGELGVRYGLRFWVVIEGTKYEITSVEVDALDLPLNDFANLNADSKQLLCLINMLKHDKKFKLAVRYIFPMNKLLSVLAIYNDMGFLASIGQVSVADGATWVRWRDMLAVLPAFGGAEMPYDAATKPGMYGDVIVDEDDIVQEVITAANYTYSDADPKEAGTSGDGHLGWTSYKDRNKFGGWMVRDYDEWDQVLLRNTKSRIKKLFKLHYYGRDFDIGEIRGKPSGAQIHFRNLKELFSPRPGERILPIFRKKRLTENPFNANNEICESAD
tara:strand:- start:334 stop:1410 length:1077 start_codon:yes stop_codon:yes gene_type:complete